MVKRALLVGAALAILTAAGSMAAWRLADGSRHLAAFTISTKELTTLSGAEPGPRLTSPAGEYEVAVTDSGIVWTGPDGSIKLTAGGVVLKSTAGLSVQGSGLVNVQGTQVQLCGAASKPVARVGDLTNATVTFTPTPIPHSGPIFQGSTTVYAC